MRYDDYNDAMFRVTTQYEWVTEPIDKWGDIIDPQFSDTLATAIMQGRLRDFEGMVKVDLGLVRYRGSDAEGELERDYAYIIDGVMPTEFPGGVKVPKRFQTEFEQLGKLYINLEDKIDDQAGKSRQLLRSV